MSKKKEYENIFAKLAENHNQIVPLLRSLKLSTVKVRNRKILSLRDTLEDSKDVHIAIDLFTEYLITNSFILEYLDKEYLDECYHLIKTKEESNVIIGVTLLYSLVEDKKKEIKEKLT